jgi:hypothetical protein
MGNGNGTLLAAGDGRLITFAILGIEEGFLANGHLSLFTQA